MKDEGMEHERKRGGELQLVHERNIIIKEKRGYKGKWRMC